MEQTTTAKIGNYQSPILTGLKYCLYARKSTEQDELQALSIDSQLKEMAALAEREGLEVVDVKKESHSAKDSGERPIFNQMLSEIRKGMYNGILAWAPDRLARNAGDLGSIVDMMDQGKIVEIRTFSQKFTNSPAEKFMLMILGSQAKLENDNKGESVKRGLRAKCQMGWRPGMPPLGYLHDRLAKKGERKILLDPKRAPTVRKMFEYVANEGWNGHQIYRWLRKIDFRTRTEGKIYLGHVYVILRDPFYYGKFEYPVGSGQWYQGKHDPIITKEFFDKTQERLAVRPNLRPGLKEFDFTKLMKCGICGSSVTAEEKFKKLKDGSVIRYVYYHCSRVIYKSQNCHEPYIREEELIQQLLEILNRITIDKIGARERLQQEFERFQKFAKEVLGQDILSKIDFSQFDIRNYARYLLIEGTREEKRELLSCLKSELYLKNKKIYLKSKRKKKAESSDILSPGG